MDKREFRNAEVVDGPVSDRVTRSYGGGHEWKNHVAEEGRERPAFTSCGWWKGGNGGERSARCIFPWLFFDIDNEGNLTEGLETALDLTAQLIQEGFAEPFTFVSFSGRKGWHVQTSTGTLGMPFFRTSRHSLRTWKQWLEPIIDRYDLDSSVYSPLSIVRLTGSCHRDTGNRKWTLRAGDALDMEEEMGVMLDRFSGDTPLPMEKVRACDVLVTEFPDPFDAPTDRGLANSFADTWESAGESPSSTTSGRQSKNGKPIMPDAAYAAFQGLEESDRFATGLAGREMGAFVLACHWFRCGYSSERVLDLVQKWDRQRNDPPLQDDPGELPYVLEEKVNSAASQCYSEGEIDDYTPITY